MLTPGSSSGVRPAQARTSEFSSVNRQPGIPPSSALRCTHLDDAEPSANFRAQALAGPLTPWRRTAQSGHRHLARIFDGADPRHVVEFRRTRALQPVIARRATRTLHHGQGAEHAVPEAGVPEISSTMKYLQPVEFVRLVCYYGLITLR